MAANRRTKKTSKVDKPYYNFDALWSRNGIFNFIVGGRGIGKSYGAKVHAVRRAIERGEEFIYLRRFKDELSAARPSFFADIAQLWPDLEFRVNGNVAEYRRAGDDKAKYTLIGYFVALSVAQSKKSVSYPKVHTIIYDEFIIENTRHFHYLPNEPTVLTNFYSTVDRYTDRARVIFLANAVSIDNPYMTEYDLIPKDGTEWIRKRNGFIVAHFPDSKEFGNAVYQTRFGQFIKDTQYADYAVGNDFADNHDHFIGTKDSHAIYLMTLSVKGQTFSIWDSMVTGEHFVQLKRPKNESHYVLEAKDMREGVMVLEKNAFVLARMRTAYRKGKVYFDEAKTRNAFMAIF